MTKRQWEHSIEVKLIWVVTIFKECSADSILDAETLISIVSEVQIQLTELWTCSRSLCLYECKIIVNVVFNESTFMSFFLHIVFLLSGSGSGFSGCEQQK